MLQENGRVTIDELELFGKKIAAPHRDIHQIRIYFQDFVYSGIEQENFIKGFITLYKSNEVFNWMECITKPYKELEEAKPNEITKNKRLMANRKSISSLPSELHNLIYQERIDENIVKNLYLTYQKLRESKILTVEYLVQLMKEYKINNPLATQLASRCLSSGVKDFITVFCLLTDKKAINKRNDLLFSLYSKDNTIRM
jgi:hypothetical protein